MKNTVDSMLKLNIYIPTRGRFKLLLDRLEQLEKQVETLQDSRIRIFITVSINADNSYDLDKIAEYADEVVMQKYDIGADLNINFGFMCSLNNEADFLWIIGDDEPLPDLAIYNISKILINNPNLDLLIGTKPSKFRTLNRNSLYDMNKFCGNTLSFISSTIYGVNFTSEMVSQTAKFAFTSYCHLAMLNLLFYRNKSTNIKFLDVQSIVDYHYKVLADPLKPRSEYSQRDSMVFFGKILTSLVVDDRNYRKYELISWWKDNWHRVSMYFDIDDYRGSFVYGLSRAYLQTRVLAFLSKFPYWKIKDIIKPVPKMRVLE